MPVPYFENEGKRYFLMRDTRVLLAKTSRSIEMTRRETRPRSVSGSSNTICKEHQTGQYKIRTVDYELRTVEIMECLLGFRSTK